MALYAGREMLLELAVDQEGSSYVPLGGMQSKSIILAAPAIDSTNLTSDGWAEGVSQAGVATARVSGTGAFVGDEASREAARLFMSQADRFWRIKIVGLGVLSGLFKITRLEFQGTFQGEEKISLSLQSTGKVLLIEEGA